MAVQSIYKCDGDGIAEYIHNVCTKYNIQDEQITRFGFDRQYFHPRMYTQCLNKKCNQPTRVNFVWDAAHLLQFGNKDMTVDRQNRQLHQNYSKLIFLRKTFKFAVHMHRNLGINFRALVWFLATKFAPYAHFRIFLKIMLLFNMC